MSLSGCTSRGWVASEKDVIQWFLTHNNNIFSREIQADRTVPAQYLFNKRIMLIANGMAISDGVYENTSIVKSGDIICHFISFKLNDGEMKTPLLHYGIYNNDDEVIHYAPDQLCENIILEGPEKAVIHSVTVKKFMEGIPFEIDNDFKDIKYNSKDTISRAKSKIGTNKGEYNLFSHNCEHFASWCKTGKPQSKQVEIGAGVVKILGHVVGIATGHPGIGKITSKVINEIKNPKDF
jgi:hypothetical protein